MSGRIDGGFGRVAGRQGGRRGVVGRAADRAGRALGERLGQQAGTGRVELPLQGGVGLGCSVKRGLLFVVIGLQGGQRFLLSGQGPQVGQQPFAGFGLIQRGLFDRLMLGDGGGRVAAGGQRGGGGVPPALPGFQRGGCVQGGFGGGFLGFGGGFGGGFGCRQRFIARGQCVKVCKLGRQGLALGPAGLGLVPSGAAGRGLGGKAGGFGLRFCQPFGQRGAGLGGLAPGGCGRDGGIEFGQQFLQCAVGGFVGREAGFGQRRCAGCTVGIVRGLQRAQRFAFGAVGRGLQPAQLDQYGGVRGFNFAGGRAGPAAGHGAELLVGGGVKHLAQNLGPVGA